MLLPLNFIVPVGLIILGETVLPAVDVGLARVKVLIFAACVLSGQFLAVASLDSALTIKTALLPLWRTSMYTPAGRPVWEVIDD